MAQHGLGLGIGFVLGNADVDGWGVGEFRQQPREPDQAGDAVLAGEFGVAIRARQHRLGQRRLGRVLADAAKRIGVGPQEPSGLIHHADQAARRCSGLGFLGQFGRESQAALVTSAFCCSLT